jgi:hypothetical protein
LSLSVIIKSYQRPWLLGICLESILRHIGDAQIIVADDGTDPILWREAVKRYGHLFPQSVHSVDGEKKWALCKEGRFGDVTPTCGETWNKAFDKARCDTILLIEDDSYLTRDIDVDACEVLLRTDPSLLCLIGLRERCLMEPPESRRIKTRDEIFFLNSNPVWPWSFDGIFYRSDDWERIGPWPYGVATGPMEGFVQDRLRSLDWHIRPYGTATVPFCQFDAQCSVRTDNPSTYAGRFRHVDAINEAWLAGQFCPTFKDVRLGTAPWIREGSFFQPMALHYPSHLRQINFVTGNELCGDLHGEAANERWLSQRNAEAYGYGDPETHSVPEECKS